MSDFSSWIQTNWYGLGSFLVELAFLSAGVWFARNILKMMRSFQEQVGALLKLTITPPAERDSSQASAHANGRSSFAEASPYWLTPSETQPAVLSASTESGPGRLAVAWHQIASTWHGTVVWLKQPMTSSEVGTWHRFIAWLQTPAGN
jgi:hypothetical protein